MRSSLAVVPSLTSLLLACGGASAGVQAKTTTDTAAIETAEHSGPTVASQDAPPASPELSPEAAAQAEAQVDLAEASKLKLPVETPLASEVNAGVIKRAELDAVLAKGIGNFFRSVRTEPHMVKGRFSGWRILSLFADRPELQVAVLRAGDTVRRANGQSLERPETFQAVWSSLGKARELVLDIDRDGRASKLRYTIAD